METLEKMAGILGVCVVIPIAESWAGGVAQR